MSSTQHGVQSSNAGVKEGEQSSSRAERQSERQNDGAANNGRSGDPNKPSVSKKRRAQHVMPNAGGQQWTRLTGAPAWELPPQQTHDQTFTGRCRLFVANLPNSATEDSLRALFEPFGAVSEIYIGKGNTFAFIKMDTRLNAETAKQALDGKPMDGRTLRVRLAAHAAAIRVTNLPSFVSNELLYLAFSSFGTVERAIVSADDRGRSVGEGIVEFARKSSAQAALKKCQNECLLLSASATPVAVAALESRDEEEGVPEKSLAMHSQEYRAEREVGPRFAEPGSLEWEMARKWKQLAQLEAQRREALEAEIRDARDGLKSQMEYLKIDETTKQLRERLRQMETQSQKLCAEREARLEHERRREEQRRTQELVLRQQEDALLRRGHDLDHDLGNLRRQESELRQQANALQQLLDRQEAALRSMNTGGALDGGAPAGERSGGLVVGGAQYGAPQMDPNVVYGHQSNHAIQNASQSALANHALNASLQPMRPQFSQLGVGGGAQAVANQNIRQNMGANFKRRRF